MGKFKRRSGAKIMLELIVLIKPLICAMLVAIVIGSIGHICAISVTVVGTKALIDRSESLFIVLLILAVLRGVFHYIEQYSNHYIAFKILAIIRHKVFAALRKLAPAKLEGEDKGNLISIITSDIELLEVFYAHTVSPVAIAVLTSAAVLCFVGSYTPLAAAILLAGYVVVGVVIPLNNGKKGRESGMEYRTEIGDLNSFVLDSIRGIEETMQYGHGMVRKTELLQRSKGLEPSKKLLSDAEAHQKAITGFVIMFTAISVLCLCLKMYKDGLVNFDAVLMCTVAAMGSFGPVSALSNLSNNLSQTLASGERVLSLLEETPVTADVAGDLEDIRLETAALEHVTFGYEEKTVLNDVSISFENGKIYGILGESGCGKSTALKLLMRFWDANQGRVSLSEKNTKEIPTKQLRSWQGYVTQETWLFRDTIENNIKIGNMESSREAVIEAAKKASVHDFIMSLPNGYDTKISELGDNLSGGQRQRLGIARCFLAEKSMLLLDEPTSNLDALNEGIILKSLSEIKDKIVILVSHRKSTLNIADVVYKIEKK